MLWLMWLLDGIALSCSLMGTFFMLMTKKDYEKDTGKEDIHYTVGYILLVLGVAIVIPASSLMFL